MSTPLSFALVAATILIASINNPSNTLAGTCASKCGLHPIQFTPGQHIRVEVINSTPNLIKIQKPSGTNVISLSPGQKLNLEQIEDNEPNTTSLIFWSEKGLSLQAIVSKSNFGTLRLELRPTLRSSGDRSLYIMDDGRINVF